MTYSTVWKFSPLCPHFIGDKTEAQELALGPNSITNEWMSQPETCMTLKLEGPPPPPS